MPSKREEPKQILFVNTLGIWRFVAHPTPPTSDSRYWSEVGLLTAQKFISSPPYRVGERLFFVLAKN